MASIKTGRVCIKSVGREMGGYCVVLDIKKNNMVFVTGPKFLTGVKRRNSNILHLKPTEHMIEVTEKSTDEEVIEEMKKSGLIKKFNLKLPSAAQMKAKKEKEIKKAASKEEKKEVKNIKKK